MAFKHYWDTQYIKSHIIDLWLLGYPNQKDEQILGFIRFFGIYLTSISGITHQEVIEKILQSDNSKKSEAMTIIDEFVHEGIEKDIEKGIERSVINAWKNGLTPELIAKYLDYPLSLIQKIITNYKLEMGLK